MSNDIFDKLNILETLRKSAELHKKVRKECIQYIKSNKKYIDIVNKYEDCITKYSDDKSGIAFPLGFSVNNICAHDSAYINDNRRLNKNDIVKIDLGIHYDGYIIDSAQTIIVDNFIDNIDETTQNLINSTRDATLNAIKNAGVDVRLYELSEIIYETINSYDNIKPITILGGHNIKRYQIHGGKLILGKPHPMQMDMRMEENEIYAIETFASTGTGDLMNLNEITHYKQNKFDKQSEKYMKNNLIKNYIINRNGLPFNSKWIHDVNKNQHDKIKKELNDLTRCNILEAYPPLSDINRNSKTSQLEHTIFIKNSGIENLSISDDY